ncbi:PQQ-binding-like beta-propeller repeat protein [Streptomyces parvulus]|uniref:PQQ-binding-like beta-propeller repeat protein n=1 Tax=Streptomyces parvulus TaxID=146923 RepID=UPI001E4F2B0B|nr:PQQ-binding-like beta-propeller repeat protein [Streptomyces parvulus]MCC9158277.1 PQQ-binding-like beta-propeller repeat protein [Streptomyces parvulus]MCE7690796.1 PQQ-binding-like beta-propeller repeat protein [Streptomyces parvulus]
MRRRRVPPLLVLLAALGGCFAPQPPDLSASEVPERAFSVPLPVPTDEVGDWSLVDARNGVVGQGRWIARIDEDGRTLWRTRLPAEFALTAKPGRPHAGASGTSPTVLVGAAPPGMLPALASVDPSTGRFLRLAPSPSRPAGELRMITLSSARQAVAATCRTRGSCTLVAWDPYSGQVQWTRRTVGSAVFAAPCGQQRGRKVPGLPGQDACRPLTFVADGRIEVLGQGEQRLHGRRVDLPPGEVAQVYTTTYRTLVVTAPHGPACRVRVAAYDTVEQAPAPVWQRDFVWEQPQAAVRDGCRRDPAIPLLMGFRLTLPDAEGALIGDDYDGEFRLRLRPGEYPVAHEGRVLAYRAGRGFRDPDPAKPDDAALRPAQLPPDAEPLGNGIWYVPGAARRGTVIAVDVYGEITWRRTVGGPPFFLGPDRLVHADGPHLTALRAER